MTTQAMIDDEANTIKGSLKEMTTKVQTTTTVRTTTRVTTRLAMNNKITQMMMAIVEGDTINGLKDTRQTK